ncbi:hypothetical protein JW926_03880 [Candidatus Sumerlaeota bacterium]|nr:hypothetical protein [Candidatus Sumerlaeota bacterium]
MKIRNFLAVAVISLIMGIRIPLMAQNPDTIAPPQRTPSPQRTPITTRRTPTPPKPKTPDSGKTAPEKYSSSRKESAVPKKGRTSRSKGLSIGPTYQPPQFTMQANLKNAVLHFYPSDRTVVASGDPFITLIILNNPKGEPFDSVFLALKYNPVVFEPIGYSDNIPSEYYHEQPQVTMYKKDGILTYSALLNKPFLAVNDEILSIQWKALVPQSDSPISLVEFQGKSSGLFKNGVDILGEPDIGNDGFIPAHITSVSENVVLDAESGEDVDEFSNEWEIFRKESNVISGDGSVILALKSPDKPLKDGEVFFVDVYFRNPKALPIDNISLDIRFDPKTLCVVDYDEDNWITRDVNIFDGLYHEKFPFDFLFKNQAYNQTGRILYKNGISKSDILIQEGVMATIKFYALAAADNTDINFHLSQRERKEEGTAVFYMGNNILGSPHDPRAGVYNARLTIYPK